MKRQKRVHIVASVDMVRMHHCRVERRAARYIMRNVHLVIACITSPQYAVVKTRANTSLMKARLQKVQYLTLYALSRTVKGNEEFHQITINTTLFLSDGFVKYRIHNHS